MTDEQFAILIDRMDKLIAALEKQVAAKPQGNVNIVPGGDSYMSRKETLNLISTAFERMLR